MKLIRTTSVVAAAIGLLAFGATEAAAQAPTLSVTANGNSVTIQWTDVAGAQGYNLVVGNASGASNIANVTLPASITRIVVAAPNGFYALRVRAVAGPIQGPFSNEVTITVGAGGPAPSPCTQPTRPQVRTTASGLSVTVNWDNIPGAQYTVQYSRFSGATEYAQTVSQNSHTLYVGIAGTFYVRVVATTACGSATSDEVSFRLEAPAPGSGPRTPDPAPGTLIPRASLGYALGIIQQVANQYRNDLLHSCAEEGGNNIFMFRVVQALRQRDSRWGMNEKRGNQGLSQDIIAFNPTNRPDNGEPQVYLFDVIAGHCTSNPDVWMADVTDVTWAAGQQGLCSNAYCAKWTIDAYLRAGFPADKRE